MPRPERRATVEWDTAYVDGWMSAICADHPTTINPTDGGTCYYELGGRHCLVGQLLAEHNLLTPEITDRNYAANELDAFGVTADRSVLDRLRDWQSVADQGAPWGDVPAAVAAWNDNQTTAAV